MDWGHPYLFLLAVVIVIIGSAGGGGKPDAGPPLDACGPDAVPNEPLYLDRKIDLKNRSGGWVQPVLFPLPGYNVSYNGKGLRDDAFDRLPPSNTTRILVIGDSFTYGVGLNDSQRFTEQLEQKLDSAHQHQDIEVINAGHEGMGMRDYYQFLSNRGIHYHPDSVIIAFHSGGIGPDAVSRQQHDRMGGRALSALNISAFADVKEPKTYQRLSDKYRTYRDAYLRDRSWETSQIRIYGNYMQQLAEQHNFDLHLYHFLQYRADAGMGSSPQHTAARWERRCNVSVIRPPAVFQNTVPQRYRYPDGPLNAAGNRILAEQLYNVLRT